MAACEAPCGVATERNLPADPVAEIFLTADEATAKMALDEVVHSLEISQRDQRRPDAFIWRVIPT